MFDRQSRSVESSGFRRFFTFILFGTVIALGTLQVRAWLEDRKSAFSPRDVTPRGELGAEELSNIEIFKETAPAVAFITNISLVRVRESRMTYSVQKRPQGTGSGFVWDNEGHIVTNFHVIQGGREWQVVLDGKTYDAKLAGVAQDKDLAVLKIDAPPESLLPIKLGTSSDLLEGQKVLAIGNPFGLDNTLTTGVVSALGREIESVTRLPIQGVIQTSAAINPGNSGGPLLDSAGRLIGVNTAIYSPSGASVGLGFAVPVDTVNRIVPQLIEHGKVIKPGLGIELNDRYRVDGVLVMGVVKGGGAEEAGIRPPKMDRLGRVWSGDVVVAIDGEKVTDGIGLYRLLDNKRIGDVVEVTIRRGEETLKTKVTLKALAE